MYTLATKGGINQGAGRCLARSAASFPRHEGGHNGETACETGCDVLELFSVRMID